ncbi:MAG: tRNA lysidine(34) synthetase TilS [Defluviitaleaceae bacterium]|nr:tRNA lysidine(34) synthetase TilS [Defluviitaleaceae bacterium]
MEKITAQTIEKYAMINSGDHVLVALSGGADSCSLLHILQKLGFVVSALHVNHNLRGNESYDDQHFAESFCKNLGVPFYVYTCDVKKIAKDNKLTIEEAGRKLRYQALTNLAQKIAATKIATAHNKNDNAETVILNLTRGAGIGGLRGIPPTRGNVVRPLINCSRKEIEKYCTKNNIQYVTDSTNANLEYNRNKIRHTVLPYLVDINKNLLSTISVNSQILANEDDYMQQAAQQAYDNCAIAISKHCLNIDILALKSLHPALQRRVVRIAISHFCNILQNFTYDHVLDIIKLTNRTSGKKITLPMKIIAEKSYNTLILHDNSHCLPAISKIYYPVNLHDFFYIKEKNFYISCTLKKITKNGYINTCTKSFNCDKIASGLVLRTRQPKDILLIKNSGTQKLKNYFINQKIPISQRDMPLLAVGNNVIWIFGHYYTEEDNCKNKIYIQIWEKQK